MAGNGVLLDNIDLFQDIPGDVLEKTSALCTVRKFEPDEIIFSQGDASNDVCFLISGSVRASIFTYSGKNVVFQDINPGKTFGLIAALDEKGSRSATIEAMEISEVAFMGTAVFVELMSSNPTIMQRVFKSLADDVRRLSLRVVEFSTLTVHNRIHAELLRLAKEVRPGKTKAIITPNPTLADIANRISTHREAVSREISRLTKSGLLKRQSGSLVITNMQKLEKMVREAEGE